MAAQSSEDFLTEFVRALIKVDPLARHEVIKEWAPKLDKLREGTSNEPQNN